ncbi:MAG: HAMP domain-containing sensor histidine kinase [Bryobacteraceae bacterium]|jgi:nitrogen fixation/metabolism regulation signal transduction histidine kinase
MSTLRSRLILIFVAATLAPLCLIGWLSVRLLNYSLALAPTAELDQVSRSLEKTGHELYRRACESLKQDALTLKRVHPQEFSAASRATWPPAVQEFFSSGEAENFILAGSQGDRVEYLVRRGDGVAMYTASLNGVAMQQLSDQYTGARALVAAAGTHDWRRGFTYTYLLLAAAIWLLTFLALLYFAQRISHPIQELTKGLSEVAAGQMDYRVPEGRTDEIGSAARAFNNMADQLKQSQERLVYVTRLESWQTLARKMAHEVKNSLTPIRLTMEEIAVRQSESGSEFYQQAAQIVVDEVLSLERRVRAFSEFSAEPPVSPKPIDINSLLQERIAFLRTAHPDVVYSTRLAPDRPRVFADEDLVKGVLTNLLENAAQAVSPGGTVLGVTISAGGKITVEVHDSGPGVSLQARGSLFQPSISFKRGGMGLGLSIARKSALLAGGDIQLVPGELGGAAFRVLLPVA